MSWSTSELRVRLAPLNRFKPSSKIFYWPFQGGTSFVDLLCFCSVLCLLCFVRVCLYVLCGHLLGKGWPLGSRLWCLLWVCHFPIGILGQVWYLIVSIPDLCTITYFCSRTTMQWHRWVSNPLPLGLESIPLPLSHCAPSYHTCLYADTGLCTSYSTNTYLSFQILNVLSYYRCIRILVFH